MNVYALHPNSQMSQSLLNTPYFIINTGQYRYMDPWGNDIAVQYWSDSLGFHQTDNRPKFDLQPVTETPEVREARAEHERAWKEAARVNGIDVDSNGFYQSESDDLDGQLSNQHAKYARYPVLSYDGHINSDNAKDFGDVRDEAVIVDAVDGSDRRGRARFTRQFDNVEEVTSEPRGFFYNFDYPVSHIKALGEQHQAQPSENIVVYARVGDDPDQTRPAEIVTRISAKIAEGLAPEDEVHDVQVSPKQRAEFDAEKLRQISAKIKSGILPEDEVQDSQISPKQHVEDEHRISAKISAGILPEDEVHSAQISPKQTFGLNTDEHRISAKISAGILPEDEVHDVQINPKQKISRSVNRGRGSIRYKDTI